MGEHKLVRLRQRGEREGRLVHVFFLHAGLGQFTAFQQGIAAERGDHPHAGSPIVATMAALMVCSRFSAWSNTMEAGDSKTSSVTSSASSPRLS